LDILGKAAQIITKHPLCNHCLGRQFALLGYGVENEKRGEAIKLLLMMKGHQLGLADDPRGIALVKALATHGSYDTAVGLLRRLKKRAPPRKACFLCQDKFESVERLASKAASRLEDYEYTTFLVGIELPKAVGEREDELKAQFNVTHGESMKSHFSREIGKAICELTKKDVSYGTQDVVVLIDPFTTRVRLQVNPLYVAGRYRKLVRGIPQSRWLCRGCGGKGCEDCDWTGKRYQESVEELVGTPIQVMTEGEAIAFHGAGREDVDARMLGAGRPFALEVKKPKKRFVDLVKLEETINEYARGKVEVRKLRFADRSGVRKLKRAESAVKVYRAAVDFERDVSDQELAEVEDALTNAAVRQQTPRRVLHRRADLTREKYIYETKVKRLSRNRAELQIRCQGGLYIKELVTGDEGRTTPSVVSILNTKATPVRLDVLSVVAGEER
jgi:tRNA pseudouridine synthase 10